jgi:hypothetical protein
MAEGHDGGSHSLHGSQEAERGIEEGFGDEAYHSKTCSHDLLPLTSSHLLIVYLAMNSSVGYPFDEVRIFMLSHL